MFLSGVYNLMIGDNVISAPEQIFISLVRTLLGMGRGGYKYPMFLGGGTFCQSSHFSGVTLHFKLVIFKSLVCGVECHNFLYILENIV